MKKLLALSILLYLCIQSTAQTDSATAYYIKTLVDRIEERLPADKELIADTTITDDQGSITVHTKYYLEPASNDVEKIVEKTTFGSTTTEIIVYYRGGTPIMFSTKQWQGAKLYVDFDYYYQTDNPVYVVKREFGKGNPDGDEILKWCYQLLKESKNTKLMITQNDESRQDNNVNVPSKKPAGTKKPLLPFFKKKKKG